MNICKPPDPLSFTGNNAKNWQDFKEQLQWFLTGTELTEKDDAVKIGIMHSHAGRETREVFKTLHGPLRATKRSLIRYSRHSRLFAHRKRTFSINDMGFGRCNKTVTKRSTRTSPD